MTPRERTLALVVAALVGLLGLWYAGSSVYRGFADRDRQTADLRQALEDADFQIQRGMRIAERLSDYENQSLPKAPEMARSLYKNWLVKTVSDLRMQNVSVDAGSVRSNAEIYDAHSFNLTCIGDLEQVTQLLYELQFAPILHRVQRFSLRPIKDKKELDVSLTVDVLSMPAAPAREELPGSKANAAAPPVNVYQRVILDRNLFAPENQAPNLRLDSTFVAYRGRSFELVAKAEDPDKLDSVRYEADVSQLPGARFSSRDGRLQWTPAENGEFPVTIVVRDDGFPNREIERQVKITVKDPPPPEAAPAAPAAFNVAKLAVITAITEIAGEPQVWVSLRHEGRTLKLRVGEKFRIGEVEGHIAAVDGKQVVIAAGERQITATLGDSLAK